MKLPFFKIIESHFELKVSTLPLKHVKIIDFLDCKCLDEDNFPEITHIHNVLFFAFFTEDVGKGTIVQRFSQV